MKQLWHFARIITAAVFLFSGFTKGVDLYGAGYKLEDYFYAWNMAGLAPWALTLATVQAFLEFAMGAALLCNIFMRLTALLSLLAMLFFTALTFVIALTNPVSDCGCFGDALVLTNWQTFFKNLVLLPLSGLVFCYRREYGDSKRVPGLCVGAALMAAFAVMCWWSYNHLPLLDFRPFHIGANIPESMAIPPDAKPDVYKTEFWYRNVATGKVQKFDADDIPWQDSLSWQFERAESKLLKRGFHPKINSFSIQTLEGQDVTGFILQQPSELYLLTLRNPAAIKPETLARIRALNATANSRQIPVLCLTSAPREDIRQFMNNNELLLDIYFADDTTLKTMIRSDPGLFLLKNGTILQKWHHHDFPK
ncbi:MAG: DoxX family protein [Bacteroidales bacterium]|jgi:uncharacterized membrane protein YphA (DoxX/SURF4 family)|nr:DoxX family protein [Bacteroidales bacterium]